jgi:hypothetical protein
VLLVHVDEDEIERFAALLDQCRQRIDGRADAHFCDRVEPSPPQIRPGNLGVARVQLQADEPTIGRKRPAEPDRAVAGHRPDLEDPLRALDLRDEVEELALRRRDLDLRHAGIQAGLNCGIQDRVGWHEQLAQVLVHMSREVVGHASDTSA